jgi:uncharacterized protein with NAD-binding domain and iron-sulfur cluster
MVDNIPTVQTQAFQIWLRPTLAECGWPWSPAVVGAYEEPFDTWADMSHLLPREAWPQAEPPGSIHYFCNVMPGPPQAPDRKQTNFPRDQHALVRASAVRFLREDVGQFLPEAVHRYFNDFKWDLLAGAPPGVTGEARFDSQFWRANIDPSDRYVLSVPCSSQYRLPPGDSGFANLYIAGDWTRCVLNAGCVEAAVISGMLAANAISGRPRLRDIVGYGGP